LSMTHGILTVDSSSNDVFKFAPGVKFPTRSLKSV